MVGAGVVGADLVLAPQFGHLPGVRAILSLAGLAALLAMSHGSLTSVGLRLRPVQGWRYWVKATLVVGLLVGVLAGVMTAIGWALGLDVSIDPLPPERIGSAAYRMCVTAPLVEEAVYRLVLCTAAAAVLGVWPTVVLSGMVFGYLHVRYQCPGPDNLVAGFFLGWAYLRSGSIVIPIVLHSLGNFCVIVAEVFVWACGPWMSAY